jgi:hypothetical protein
MLRAKKGTMPLHLKAALISIVLAIAAASAISLSLLA